MNKNIQAIYPLTPMQEGMLYHTIEMPGADIYFQQFACKIEGLDDPKKWQKSWQEVAQNHPIMRTLFTWENRPKPLQVVREHVNLPWTDLDWREYTQEQQADKWASLTQRDRDLNFDMTTAPLARITMVNLGANCHQFLFSFHHILLDGWSQRLLLDQAVAYYNESTHYESSNRSTYSDFIDWLGRQDKAAAEAFWKKQLAGFEQVTNIVNDVSPAIDNADAGVKTPDINIRNRQELVVAPDIVDKLKTQIKHHHLTLNSLFLGAWALILGSHNNTQDVLFGTTVAGRPTDLPDADKIVGLFINTLPFRAKINAQSTVLEWLTTLQSSQAACRQFEQTPLTDIQRYSDVSKGTSLFESILVVENLSSVYTKNAKSKLVLRDPSYTEFSHYPLAILVDPSDGLSIIALHQESKVSTARANEVLSQINTVLTQMSESLDLLVADISTLPKKLTQKQLIEWNKTQHNFLDLLPVHKVFEQWAANTPNKMAIIDTTGEKTLELTYDEVNKKANQLAAYLKAQGLPTDAIVPILLERSANALISFLAVMKAGCAYIPLDSNQPTQRNSAIFSTLQEDKIWVITQKSLQHQLAGATTLSLHPILLEEHHREIESYSHENLQNEVSLEQLAYVIYTSGSTGLPKGVMIEHKALANSTMARNKFYTQSPTTFLLMSPLATDSSIAGLYWTLCSGNTLVLPKKRIEQDMHALGRVIKEYSVSHTLLIPSLYQLVLENANTEDLQSLTTIIVAGESCTQSVIRKHHHILPSAQLFNEYGPSECCVWATAICLSDWNSKNRVSIGKPIANTLAYILDQNANVVLPEVVGELYLGGNNLAKGYLNDTARSAQAFIQNPFSGSVDTSNTHLYKTGDLAKYNANGNIVYVGRADNQVKVRGFRVEPEEIEYALAMHPNIDEALAYVETPLVTDAQLMEALISLSDEEATAILAQIQALEIEQDKA